MHTFYKIFNSKICLQMETLFSKIRGGVNVCFGDSYCMDDIHIPDGKWPKRQGVVVMGDKNSRLLMEKAAPRVNGAAVLGVH